MGKGKKIIVAMSGGVDSSVCAALLKHRGFEIKGVYMRLFDEPRNNAEFTRHKFSKAKFGRAGAEQREKSESAEGVARAVARKLDIPFKILDLRKEFKDRVVNYFLREFTAGRTPNPCVVCNQQIKFGLLLEKAMEMGGDYIATGHYARIKKIHPTPPLKKEGVKNSSLYKREVGRDFYGLFAASDKTKDQSYFLYNLTQEKLRKILFPIGDYKKSAIYKLADRWQLPYKKRESVDICFIGEKGHRDFLKKHLGVKPGKIIDVGGKILGKHHGLWFYTIGQRADIGGPGPFYVVKLDVKNNAVVVSNKFRDQLLYKRSLATDNVNWVSGVEPDIPLKCRARIRYGHTAVPCVIARSEIDPSLRSGQAPQSRDDSMRLLSRQLADRGDEQFNYLVKFKNLQRAITPGQSVVFYKRNEVLGGGVIES